MAGGLKRAWPKKLGLLGVLASLAVLAAGLIGGASANAVGSDHASCVFSGLAGNLNPPIPPPPAGNGQTGTYNFNGSATCVAADVDEGNTSNPIGVNIVSNGRYSNIACGTGTATGDSSVGPTTITQTSGAASSEFPVSGTGSSLYTIQFTGGTGPLVFGSGLKDGDGEAISGGGEVTITPANTGGCVTQSVAAFNVAGQFHAEM